MSTETVEPPQKKRRTVFSEEGNDSIPAHQRSGESRTPSEAAVESSLKLDDYSLPQNATEEDRAKRNILLGLTSIAEIPQDSVKGLNLKHEQDSSGCAPLPESIGCHAPMSSPIQKHEKSEVSNKTVVHGLTTTPSNSSVGPSSGANVTNLVEDDGDTGGCGPVQYHCDFCQRDISDVFRVRCAECQDFDLCVTCFTSGVETGAHKNNHNYIPIGRNDLSLFTPDWNADEEIMLLEGVSKFGFGNWAEVADLVGPYNANAKKKEDCEEHYYSVHIAPYRTTTSTTNSFAARQKVDMHDPHQRRAIQECMIGKHHQPLPEPLKTSPGSAACKIVGFMPLRGDFDVEYDNDAELILSDIEFRGDETPQERELKWKVLDIYNSKLDERILRKRVVIEKGLADWRRVQQMGKKKSKEEADLHNLFRLLVRFNLSPDPDELVQLLITEGKLRQRLHMLQEWQSLGLETYEQVEEYENSKLATMSGFGTTDGITCKPRIHSLKPQQTSSKDNPLPSDTSTQERSITHVTPTICPLSESTQVNGQSDMNSLPISRPQQPGMRLEANASDYPGAQLLTEKEIQFCDHLQIPPVYFLFAKHTLLNSMASNTDPSKLQALDVLRLAFDLPQPIPPPASSFSVRLPQIVRHSSRAPSPSSTLRRTRARRRPMYLNEPDDFVASHPSDNSTTHRPLENDPAHLHDMDDMPLNSLLDGFNSIAIDQTDADPPSMSSDEEDDDEDNDRTRISHNMTPTKDQNRHQMISGFTT